MSTCLPGTPFKQSLCSVVAHNSGVPGIRKNPGKCILPVAETTPARSGRALSFQGSGRVPPCVGQETQLAEQGTVRLTSLACHQLSPGIPFNVPADLPESAVGSFRGISVDVFQQLAMHILAFATQGKSSNAAVGGIKILPDPALALPGFAEKRNNPRHGFGG